MLSEYIILDWLTITKGTTQKLNKIINKVYYTINKF